MQSIILRSGKATCCPVTVSGMDRAAAKETTPRIPVHPRINGAPFPGLRLSATVINLPITIVTTTAA